MKNEQLLDAIGGIDEKLLAEAESAPHSRSGLPRRVFLAAAVICALAVTVAATTGLLSRPIHDSEIVTDETVAPFSMDAEGNIVLQGVEGLKVTMDVEVDPNAPEVLEELYVLNPGQQWEWSGYSGAGDEYHFYSMENIWKQAGKTGEIRLVQDVVSYYTEGIYGDKCVDTLPGLSADTGVTQQIVTIGGIQAVKVTIPALPDYTSTDYCTEGETRLYWTDGSYFMHLDYPHWMTDAEAEVLLATLTKDTFVTPTPENYGKIDPQSIAERLPYLSFDSANGTSAANNIMGLGQFAYGDGWIYMAGPENNIYRYDPATEKTETLLLANERVIPHQLMVTDQYVLYTDKWSALYALKKDGTVEKPVYQGIFSSQLHADGTTLYTSRGIMDLQTGTIQEWPEPIISYYVDENYIYAVKENGNQAFLRAPKGTLDFQEIALNFRPIKILVHGDAVYMTEGDSAQNWNVIRYRNGESQRLPVSATEYQVLGDKLIFRDESSDGRVLKSYDLNTGITETLCNNTFTFSILEDRYICVFCASGQEQYYTVIDTHSGTTTEIVP